MVHLSKCQSNARIRRRRSQMRSAAGSQEGVCESQRRARAKRRAYNDDPKAAAAEDFPKRQRIEIHVQINTSFCSMWSACWHLLLVLVGSGCAERDGRRIRASQSVLFALSARAMLLPPVKWPHRAASPLCFSTYQWHFLSTQVLCDVRPLRRSTP